MNIIASNLLIKREEKRLTQAYIAYLSGMSQPNYSDIERGKTRPSIDQLKRFSQILEVTVDELINEPRKQKKPQVRASRKKPREKISTLIRVIAEKDVHIRMLENQLADLRKKED